MKITMIGAGIGGLTTAIALQQKGISSTIFEQAPTIQPIGAGIILANNAMQVYEKLGLKEKMKAAGNPISFVNIRTADLKLISSMDLRYFEKKYGVQNIAIHRGKLQEILLQQLDKNSVKLGYALSNIQQDKSSYELQFKNGETAQTEYLIAADGLNSVVRKTLFPASDIRHTQQICWRGLTDFQLPKKYQHELNETWGKGDRFGFVQIAPQKVYWYALKTIKAQAPPFRLEDIADYFKGYHELVSQLIKATPNTYIHTAEISDLSPIKKWHQDKVCLMGDAAHATTPNMGQGACQAIEDAYVLAACMNKYEWTQAFAEFQKRRISKAQQVVNNSWTLGKVAHWENSLAVSLRNTMMRWTPQSVSRKQSEKIFELDKI